MVRAEGGAVGQTYGEVREDREEPVCRRRSEGQVVADLVDGQEQVLVRRRAHHVRQGPEGGGEEGRVSYQVRAEYLDRDDEEDDVFR